MGVRFAKVVGGWTYQNEEHGGWICEGAGWTYQNEKHGVGFAKVDGRTYKNEVHGSQICEGGRWLDIQKREGYRAWIVKVWVAGSLKNEGRRWPGLQKWGWQDSPLPKLRAEGPRVARKRAGAVTFSK